MLVQRAHDEVGGHKGPSTRRRPLAVASIALLALIGFVGLPSAAAQAAGAKTHTAKARTHTASTRASAGGATALILGDSVSPGNAPDGSGDSLEQYEAIQDGFTTTVVTGAEWDAMTKSQFASYQVLIIGDPTCDATGSSFAAALSNQTTWEPVVMTSGGNKTLVGTDPTFHYLEGHPGDKLEAGGIAFAGAVSGATGAYVDLSCAYQDSAGGTPVPLLDGLSTHGSAQFTTIGEGPLGACATGVNIVANSGPTTGLTDADLSNWSCSVHEAFDSFPSDYTPLALAPVSSGFPSSYCADDVESGTLACGSPYLMVSGGGVVVKSDVTLTPASQNLATGGSASLVANVKASGTAVSGGSVVFNVDSGPNVGKTFTGTTDSSGNTTFTYSDSGGAGTDSVSATYTDAHGVVEKATASVTWGGSCSTGSCCFTGSWPSEVTGYPKLHAHFPQGLYIGQVNGVWSVYGTHKGSDGQVYRGTITTDGTFGDIGQFKFDGRDTVALTEPAANEIKFRFINRGYLDGIAFTPMCGSEVSLAITVNGSPASPGQIFLGAGSTHPSSSSLSFTRSS